MKLSDLVQRLLASSALHAALTGTTFRITLNEAFEGRPLIRKENRREEARKNEDPREVALQSINDITTNNMGSLCVTEDYRILPVNLPSVPERFEDSTQRADMAAAVIQELGINHKDELLKVLLRGLITPDRKMIAVRAVAMNMTTSGVINSAGWKAEIFRDNRRVINHIPGPELYTRLDSKPWYQPSVTSGGKPIPQRGRNYRHHGHQGWWTLPYYSCFTNAWTVSYALCCGTKVLLYYRAKGFLGLDFNLTDLEVNQCDMRSKPNYDSQLTAFLGTHKCHNKTSNCEFKDGNGWARGSYLCHCRPGYYFPQKHKSLNGTIV
ncbi:hypothetical protein J437_LFUL018658, partial [Ladona fulva]